MIYCMGKPERFNSCNNLEEKLKLLQGSLSDKMGVDQIRQNGRASPGFCKYVRMSLYAAKGG